MNQPLARNATVRLKTVRWCSLIAFAAMLMCQFAAADDERIDDVMYQDPAFPDVVLRIEFPDDLKPLWLQALARPEAELQRMAADTIALAHRSGMPDLDVAAARLLEIFQQAKEPTVRRAAANALVALNANQAARPFAESMATASLEIAKIIELALAHWNYEPARTVWRARLSDSETERARLQLAIQCLAIAKDSEASPALLRIVQDANAEVSMRLSAARAAAEINDGDVITAASTLASVETGQPTASLLAATLLTGQMGPEAVAMLKRLAAVDAVTTRGVALRRLFEIDPSHVYEFVPDAIRSTDVNLRQVGSEALVRRADADAIRQLAPLLNDVNPGLRRAVSAAMLDLAEQASLRDSVIQATTDIVAGDAWRGLEQGVIVLASLDHEPVAPRLIELLTHRRPEISVVAAWGLRKLAMAETLPAMLAQAERQTQLIADETFEPRYLRAMDLQLSQMFQMFGELDYREAEPLMRRFIPKRLSYAGAARPAAVWAIGKLHEGTVDEELARMLAERLADVQGIMPEMGPVRRMSAIGLGRMKAESQANVLRRFVIEVPGFSGQACAWSLERITGEKHEFSLERVTSTADWFLIPSRANRPTETD